MDNDNEFRENPFLNQPLAEIPKVDPQFFIDEFLRWLSEDYFDTSASDKILTDTTTIHKDWPRLIDSNPKLYEWDPFIVEDDFLKLKGRYNFIDREISYSHLIFIIETLSAIKNKLESFITSYASFQQLTKLLEISGDGIYEGESLLLNRLKDQIQSRILDQSKQLIPKLYHFRDHGCLMSVDLDHVNHLDIKTQDYIYEFRFSKTSSDAFAHVLIEIINERLIKIQNLFRLNDTDKSTSSYQWKNITNFQYVAELGNALKSKGFIDPGTRMVDFRALFEGHIKNAINWIGESTLSEILYLMYLLWEDERFKWVTEPKQHYKNLANCFLNNGTKFTYKYLVIDGNAKSLYIKIKNGKELPKRAKTIENILVQISMK